MTFRGGSQNFSFVSPNTVLRQKSKSCFFYLINLLCNSFWFFVPSSFYFMVFKFSRWSLVVHLTYVCRSWTIAFCWWKEFPKYTIFHMERNCGETESYIPQKLRVSGIPARISRHTYAREHTSPREKYSVNQILKIVWDVNINLYSTLYVVFKHLSLFLLEEYWLFFPIWPLLLYGIYDYRDCFPIAYSHSLAANLTTHFMKTVSMKMPRYILKNFYFKKTLATLDQMLGKQLSYSNWSFINICFFF